MRILLDARLYGLENAGLGRYTINLIEELKKIDNKNEYIILLRKKYFDELTFPKNWKKVLADYKHYTLIEQIRLPMLISSYKPDLVHFLHFNFPIFYKGKFVVTIHDLLMQEHRGAKATTLPLYLYYPKQLAAKYVFKKAVTHSLAVIVPSKAVKKEVVDYFGVPDDKIVVTYEGFDKKFALALGGSKIPKKYGLDRPYFLYAGNAYPHKNLERVVEATIQLNKEIDEKILFAIASARGVFIEKIQAIIVKMNAQDCVRVLGFVPDEDLPGLYRNSLAFLYPSLSEGFGLQGIEAMAAGTLVLASDIPVFKEIYKDAAIYFNPYDFASIEKAMEDVISMKQGEREKLIAHAGEFVKRYSWSKMAQETLKVYESCIGL